MWIIGLLLLAAAVVVGIEIGISSNNRQVDIEAFSHVWTSNAAAAFVVGVITALVGAFGLWLMFWSMRRSRIRRRERRADLAERDRLADERRREVEAMSTTGRGDRDERGVATDYGDRDRVDRERERVPADRRDDDVDLRDEHRDERRDDIPRDERPRDEGPRDERRDDDVREALEEHEAEHHRRGGILHRQR